MQVKQITSIIDRYGNYKNSIRQLKSDLHTYRINNALQDGEDENTLAIKLEIAEKEAELGRFLDMEV